MNRKNLWFLPAIALVLVVAFSSCGKDDNPTAPSLNGTYAGTIGAYIPGLVDDEFEEDFTIATAGGKTTLSLTLNVPVEIPGAGTQIMPLPLNLELKDVTTVANASVVAAAGDYTATVTLNGHVFNAADFSFTIPVVGGTIALQGLETFTYGSKKYHGLQGIVKGSESEGTGVAMILSGTASGGPFPQTLPAVIMVDGIKK